MDYSQVIESSQPLWLPYALGLVALLLCVVAAVVGGRWLSRRLDSTPGVVKPRGGWWVACLMLAASLSVVAALWAVVGMGQHERTRSALHHAVTLGFRIKPTASGVLVCPRPVGVCTWRVFGVTVEEAQEAPPVLLTFRQAAVFEEQLRRVHPDVAAAVALGLSRESGVGAVAAAR